MSSVVLFRTQHWRPIIERPTTLRSSHAQPSSTAIRLVYVKLSTSSRPCQSRLSYANLVSSLSTSSLLRQPRLVVSFKPCSSGQLPFSLSFFCMRSFFVKFIFVNFFVVCVRARVFVKHYQVRGPIMVSHALIFGCLAKV